MTVLFGVSEMDYALRQLENVELLEIYTLNKNLVDNVINKALPAFYWALKVCEWSGDFKEAKFFDDARERVCVKYKLAEIEMQRARNELVRRHSMWASLIETVPGDFRNYQRPDLAEVWARYNGHFNG